MSRGIMATVVIYTAVFLGSLVNVADGTWNQTHADANCMPANRRSLRACFQI